MDVVSLLNISARLKPYDSKIAEAKPTSNATEGGRDTATSLPTPSPEPTGPRKRSETRNRQSRAPWNAGGYSLPLSINTVDRSSSLSSSHSPGDSYDWDISHGSSSAMSNQSRNGSVDSSVVGRGLSTTSMPVTSAGSERASFSESDIFTNTSSGKRPVFFTGGDSPAADTSGPSTHKLSDSHSSLSSYASSHSASHSRMSSVTTVSGTYTPSSSLIETFREFKVGYNDDVAPTPVFGLAHLVSPRLPILQEREEPSPVGYEEPVEGVRPPSPSDAVLRMKGSTRQHSVATRLNQVPSQLDRLLAAPTFHKRASSAPDYTPNSASQTKRQPYDMPLPPTEAMANARARDILSEGRRESAVFEERTSDSHPEAENETHKAGHSGTGSSSKSRISHSSLEKSTSSSAMPVPDTPRRMASGITDDPESLSIKDESEETPCMFVNNCETGSQPRKAISHLFGRNKSCTLKIPKNVWVYYCRKHYQRIRYRNARAYPVNQMELVKVQICRLQAWSQRNQQKGAGPYISAWTLSLRKREQNRIERERETVEEGEQVNPESQGSTAVPEWLIQRLGSGHTTEQILEIAERLHKEIASGSLSQVPEIEFLPDIVDDDEDASAKPTRRRRQNRTTSISKTPKRKASDGSPLAEGSERRVLAARGEEKVDQEAFNPLGKRARIDTPSDLPSHQYSRLPTHSFAPDSAPSAAFTFRQDPSYSSTDGHSAPQRAPNVVPKVRQMRYGQMLHPNSESAPAYRFDGHHRTGSLGGYHDAEQSNQRYHQEFSSDYEPNPVRFDQGYSNAGPQITLPSISAQIPDHTNMQYQTQREHGAYPSSHGVLRPVHQRSASAYTPLSRTAVPATRPSSSGTGAQVTMPHFETRFTGSPSQETGTPGPPQGQFPDHQYGHGQRLLHHEYTSAPQQRSLPLPQWYGQTPPDRYESSRPATHFAETGPPDSFAGTEPNSRSSAEEWRRGDGGYETRHGGYSGN